MGRGIRIALWAGGGGILLYALLLGDGGWLRVASLKAEVRDLEAELEALRTEQAEVREDLDALQEPGSTVLEEVARERYGMHREGERVVHILGTDEDRIASEAPELEPGADKGKRGRDGDPPRP